MTKRDRSRRDTLPGVLKDARPDAFLPYLHRRFPRIGIALGLLIVVVAGIDWIANGAEKIGTIVGWFSAPPPAGHYVELVFDRSAEMARHVGSEPETKWLAARQALQHVDIARGAYLALRTFGGPCTDRLGRPDLGFAMNARQRVDAALEKLTPDGKGNLANAVIAAMDDLVDKPPLNGVNPRVVVITGSNDACTGDQVGAISDHQRRQPNVTLDFRFIGVQLADDEKRQLAAIETATKGRVIYVGSREEIGRALDTFLVWEPMEDSVGAVIGVLNDCILRLTKVVLVDLRQPDGGEADADFQTARDACKRSDEPFRDLGATQQAALGADFGALYRRASENRDMRERIISVTEKLIASTKSGDPAGYDLAQKEFLAVEATYNRQVNDLNTVLARLHAQH